MRWLTEAYWCVQSIIGIMEEIKRGKGRREISIELLTHLRYTERKVKRLPNHFLIIFSFFSFSMSFGWFRYNLMYGTCKSNMRSIQNHEGKEKNKDNNNNCS